MIEFSKERGAYARAASGANRRRSKTSPTARSRISFTRAKFAPVSRGSSNGPPHARVITPRELVDAVVAELDAGRSL